MLWVPLITGLAIMFVVIQAQIRNYDKSWGILISVTFSVIVMAVLIPQLSQVINLFHSLSDESGVSSQYLAPILKTIAIAYVASFGAEICRDADEGAMANVVELAGKIVILLVAIPVIQGILFSILRILE